MPADDAATAALDEAWRSLVGSAERHAAGAGGEGPYGCACRAPPWAWRGSSSTISASSRWRRPDYLRIAHEFHTLIIDRIPVMEFEQRNAAKRFIILIDTLYDHAVKLDRVGGGRARCALCASDGYEASEFKRTASRLIEMRSESLSRAAAWPARFRGKRIERRDR